jgi:cysteine synthase A
VLRRTRSRSANCLQSVLNRAIIDEVAVVTDDEAFQAAGRLGREEGILARVSSGAALHAALDLARRSKAAGATIVAHLADGAERYMASRLFA